MIIFEPPLTLVVTPEVLNVHPDGAFNMILVVLGSKSVATVSLITMLPNVVNDGAVPFAALSVEILLPPVAGVAVICAIVAEAINNIKIRREAVFLTEGKKFFIVVQLNK